MESTAPAGVTREKAIEALIKYVTTVSTSISNAKDSIKQRGIIKYTENLFEEGLPFFQSFAVLEELCTSLECLTVDELENRLETLSLTVDNDSDDADVLEGYFRCVTDWSKFLTFCDELLYRDAPLPSSKDVLSHQLERLSASTIAKNKSKSISEEGCQVVVITCGAEEGARKWREETGCIFPIYLDTSRELFSKFDMRRSLYKVFCPEIMKMYVTAKLSGAKFPSPYPGDDLIQIGGDILLSKTGSLEYAFHSKTAVDRLDFQSILKIIKGSKGGL